MINNKNPQYPCLLLTSWPETDLLCLSTSREDEKGWLNVIAMISKLGNLGSDGPIPLE